jgi:hydroxymethylpyrimidine kinase/phosphomethylpyrimidine kinase
MSKGKKRPAALSIAGSDSGGGAGAQADLKTFAACGVHGLSVITALTAQNPRRVASVFPVAPSMVAAQIESVLTAFLPGAAKTGMLWNKRIVHAVAAALAGTKLPLVIDPVLISTSGRRLLARDAEATLEKQLIPLAVLVTPNIPEAENFLRRRISLPEEARSAARDLSARWGCAVLVKGGHIASASEAIDFLFDGKKEWMFSAPRVTKVHTHGTGCTYSAAITAQLALGHSLNGSIQHAKDFVTRAIRHSRQVGKTEVLGLTK